MMGTRHLAAGLLLLLWLRARRGERPGRRLWRPALCASAFCFLGCHGLLAYAEMSVESGLAALLAGSLPIWMVLLARLWGQKSELTPKVLSGIGLGMVGLAILVPFGFSGQRQELTGALAILVSEVLWAVGVIYARGIKIRGVSVSMFAAMQMVCGGALLWVTGLGLGEAAQLNAASFTARSMLSLGFLIVFGSLITFTAYTWLMQVSSPALVSTHSYVNPLVAVLLGWAIAGRG